MEIPNRIIVPPMQGIKGKDMIQLANRERSRNEGSWREFKLIESALELMKVARWQHGKVNARVRLRRGCMWVNEIALEMLKAHKTPWHILSKNTSVITGRGRNLWSLITPQSRCDHGKTVIRDNHAMADDRDHAPYHGGEITPGIMMTTLWSRAGSPYN